MQGTQTRWPGIALIAIALILALTALVQFHRAKTHVEPWRPTSTLIEHGLFRYSRNPIYLAFCIATAGIGLWFNSGWILLAIAPLALVLQTLIIRREEQYLANKFGESYLAYRQRVRRWF